MKNWVLVDREQALLLPPSVDELLPEGHLARFVVDVVDKLDLSPIMAKYERAGRGSTPYHPAMMVALLFFGYATGTMSSRRIERACHEHIAFRYIAAGAYPDHGTICEFRRRHLKELSALFVQVLVMAREVGVLKVGSIAIDGTKVKANASKHAAVSYKRAKQIEDELTVEVERLMKMAEEADNTPVAEGVDLPAEIARRRERIERLEAARVAIAERHGREKLDEYSAECDEVIEQTKAAIDDGSLAKGAPLPKLPEPPDMTPPDKAQHNFTDADSRIMPDKGAFSQSYNAQAAVDIRTMLIVGQRVSQAPNDKKELLPTLDAIDVQQLGAPTHIIADAGYFSADNIADVEQREMRAWIAPGRTPHRQSLEERLAPPPSPTGIDENAKPADRMRQRLKTAEGRALYRLRKMTVEPVFGIIKSALGFRQFLLRGLEKVSGEWALVCLGYNIKRLWRLGMAT